MIEAEFLDYLIEHYRKLGYKINKQPKSDNIPFNLNGYIPDLICEKDEEHILVEIKNHINQITFDKVKEISEIVSSHQGWKFILVSPNQGSFNFSHNNISEELEISFKKINKSFEIELYDACFLYLWNLYIQLLIEYGKKNELPIEALSDQNIINVLYSEGLLSISDLDETNNFRTIRNNVTHSNNSRVNKNIVIDFYNFIKDKSKKINQEIYKKMNEIGS
ncbi:hypothetical protein [Leptospira levettii]|uniref:REase AHJR-like domain-containing protein n=1 Tax=Leptospira levettii TaxID=2023178 RepID=A0AAW5VDP0_9LEPT|nr:hypothetical protein [Leptospira levettii]MCW7467809.1 hypothetical protein [Leptospira levettii]MCW7513441.1 hypothetical protein [Leptospira levettii]MCW7517203.1 hypothetical protein [Leptospira levettii]